MKRGIWGGPVRQAQGELGINTGSVRQAHRRQSRILLRILEGESIIWTKGSAGNFIIGGATMGEK